MDWHQWVVHLPVRLPVAGGNNYAVSYPPFYLKQFLHRLQILRRKDVSMRVYTYHSNRSYSLSMWSCRFGYGCNEVCRLGFIGLLLGKVKRMDASSYTELSSIVWLVIGLCELVGTNYDGSTENLAQTPSGHGVWKLGTSNLKVERKAKHRHIATSSLDCHLAQLHNYLGSTGSTRPYQGVHTVVNLALFPRSALFFETFSL